MFSMSLWLLINQSSHDGCTWSWLLPIHVVSLANCTAESHLGTTALAALDSQLLSYCKPAPLTRLQLLQVAAPTDRSRVTRAPSFDCFGGSAFCLVLQKFTWGLETGFGVKPRELLFWGHSDAKCAGELHKLTPSRYRSWCRNWPLTLTVSIQTARPSTKSLRHNISRLGLYFPITWFDSCFSLWHRNKTRSTRTLW